MQPTRLVDDQPYVGRHGRLIRQIEIGRAIERPSVRGERQRFGALAAFDVQHVVDDDAIEPGAETAAIGEARELRDHLDQNLLRRILRIVGTIEHPPGNVVDPNLVARDELFERLSIAAASADDERFVVVVAGVIVGKRPDHDCDSGLTFGVVNDQWLCTIFHRPPSRA